MANKIKTQPAAVFAEYKKGNTYKAGLGSNEKGIFEQAKINERFFVGDQWYGAKCGNDRPLVRHNVIKRIGDYKIAMVTAAPVTASFSCDGVPNTVELSKGISDTRKKLSTDSTGFGTKNMVPDVNEINIMMSALSDYQKVTAERLKFNDIIANALQNAYISGTAVLYTYWDDSVKTGLYADERRTMAITGDIVTEILDIENVVFGAANRDDVQKQPYILIAQRRTVEELRREARKNRTGKENIENIKADKDAFNINAGARGEQEDDSVGHTTVITKLWKEYSDNGDCTVKAVRVTENAVIRPEWDLNLRLYPICKMSWDRRKSSIYGDSEVTYLIPNQIAINRMLTSAVWSTIMIGMPMLYKDSDVVNGEISNAPGQIIEVLGGGENVKNAVGYITPPDLSGNFQNVMNDLINNTLTQSGANDAALGNMRPDNMSAIIAVREAATMPLQNVQNRFYQFNEDVFRIWAEFWLNYYGNRSLKIEDENGTWYLPFNAERYKTLLISVKIDVGAATLWSEAQVISTLGKLFEYKIIDAVQYLKRLPKNCIPNIDGLIKELQERAAQKAQMQNTPPPSNAVNMPPQGEPVQEESVFSQLTAEEQAAFMKLPPEQQEELIQRAAIAGGA